MHQCAACCSTIDDYDFLECCTCLRFYHGQCVGVSPTEFERLSSDTKMSWICPECRSKKPRSDNSNTPVRPSTPTSSAHADANVTPRLGKQGTSKQAAIVASVAAQSGCSVSYVSRVELCTIMQEELRSFIKECIREIKEDLNREFKAFRNEVGSIKDSVNFISDSFDKLNTEITTFKSNIETILKEKECLRN
ncbi:unnamed protein product [Parnassius apollo]|uniref:(apollo) hypothetical protein n=1 Tax=Parnassius apollo TaxID=110799 RepID=A0A8S3XMY7_PARAO|nr:unnamed protein product [Parnassius apollo]